jgi:hypothetical protein
VRQAKRDSEAGEGAGHHYRLDPFALPVRHGEGRQAFMLDRDQALLRRTTRAGLPATLAVPVSAYRGVAVRMTPADEGGGLRVVVELMHRDPALSLPLAVAGEPEDVAADWIAWGRMLNLPLLVVEPDGGVRSAGSRLGAVLAGEPGSRRNAGAFAGRRSRFARRRKTGSPWLKERLSGREIIARE